MWIIILNFEFLTPRRLTVQTELTGGLSEAVAHLHRGYETGDLPHVGEAPRKQTEADADGTKSR